jgi:eukaryotic-like serine/threonine-protein kinase
MSADSNTKRPLVRDLFLKALDMPSLAERETYLEGACGDDTALRAKVNALLKCHEADSFLDQPAADLLQPQTASEAAPSEKPGDRIGRYKLLQRIGEGGCGVVYMAEQEEPVRRRVALKVIKLGMDTRQVIARFEAERQALAIMDHPNIAQVYDAGSTETGRPYFVMELVRGIKITDYCDENNLSTEQRLDLFIQVCHAIQHAHQKGIIHRDIKPSNILVTVNDGLPVPKVIDFGIAKATEQRLTDKTLFTAFEQFIGTPAYMSPEQAAMTSLDIDTRSDVYALGVLLYELLTGKTPFDAKTLVAAGLEEMRRIIREQEPVRPSTRLSTLQNEELTKAAKRRGTEVPRLVHLVRGDLDWIVMKCLEKDRTRRYETANGLALDIERHLGNEPVVARPPSGLYRFQKLVHRNKLAFAAAAALLAVLLLGVCVSTWQAVRATRAEREQNRLRRDAEKARANEADQRKAAEAERDRARLGAYVGDMKLADTAWRENNLGQAMTALRRQIPEAGETDLRGIEWRYLWQKCRGQASATFRHEAEVACAELSPDGRWLATESGGAFWVWDTTRQGERRALSSDPPHFFAAWCGEEDHLAFDARGRFLATATRSEVLLWNVTNWGKLRSLPVANAVLCFSGDGTKLATLGQEGIQVWKVASWEPLVEIPIRRSGDRHCMALNNDGSLLAEGRKDPYGNVPPAEWAVTLWNVPRRQRLPLAGEVQGAVRLAFSDDDRWLAACTLGPPATVWLWSVPEGKLVATWPASQGVGRALAFAPGGHRLATAGSDQVISLWETGQTNRLPGPLQGHLNEVSSLRFAADGRLVSASNDKTVCLWKIGQDPSTQPAFSLPVGQLICAQRADAHRMVTVNLTNLTFEEWDMESGQRLRQTPMQGADAILKGEPLADHLLVEAFVDTGVEPGVGGLKLLWPAESPGWDLCATTGDGRVCIWNAQSGELVYSNKVASRLTLALPVALHDKLVLFDQVKQWERLFEDTLSSYDLKTHRTELIEEHASINPYTLDISPDGRFWGYITTNGQVKVWDSATKQTKSIVKVPPWDVIIQFSRDSRLLAVSTCTQGEVRVWDAGTGKPLSDPLAGLLALTSKVSFSADSRSLVTESLDGNARIWNIATSREMISGLPLNSFLKNHLRWNLLPPDGNSILESAGEGAIRVVHLPTLAEIDALETRPAKRP